MGDAVPLGVALGGCEPAGAAAGGGGGGTGGAGPCWGIGCGIIGMACSMPGYGYLIPWYWGAIKAIIPTENRDERDWRRKVRKLKCDGVAQRRWKPGQVFCRCHRTWLAHRRIHLHGSHVGICHERHPRVGIESVGLHGHGMVVVEELLLLLLVVHEVRLWLLGVVVLRWVLRLLRWRLR